MSLPPTVDVLVAGSGAAGLTAALAAAVAGAGVLLVEAGRAAGRDLGAVRRAGVGARQSLAAWGQPGRGGEVPGRPVQRPVPGDDRGGAAHRPGDAAVRGAALGAPVRGVPGLPGLRPGPGRRDGRRAGAGPGADRHPRAHPAGRGHPPAARLPADVVRGMGPLALPGPVRLGPAPRAGPGRDPGQRGGAGRRAAGRRGAGRCGGAYRHPADRAPRWCGRAGPGRGGALRSALRRSSWPPAVSTGIRSCG